VRFDFRDPGTFGPAFRGVDRLFLIRPPGLTDVRRHITPCLRYARRAGVEQVVFLSSLGAERNPLAPDRRTENAVRATGIPYTCLRPSLLMQHLSTTHRTDIKERGEIFIPAGRGRASFVDARDVAAVAVRAFAEAGHRQRTYPLTGGEALDYYAVARISTEVLQRPVFYRAPATARFAAVELRRGRSLACVAALVVVYTAIRLGLGATVTGDTAGILGRAPTTVQRFFEDYRAVWL
jgi:uncharacterized protein YbjT (DUF2867 family)